MKTVKAKQKAYQAFTLLEMLIVLLVIALLVFLFVPNLLSQREKISQQEDQAFEQVVNSQLELYQINESDQLPREFAELVSRGYLTNSQGERAASNWKNIDSFLAQRK